VECEWDEAKNLANQKKHGISFDEAQELLLSDTDALELADADHSDHEQRYKLIGPIVRGIVTVVFTERGEDVTRIISARCATKHEIEMYQRYKEQSHD